VTGAADAVRVGVVGRDVPLELIEAFGARPHRLAGDPRADRTEADRWLGRGIDPAANARLAGMLADGFASVDAIAVANDSEASLRLYYALRELARTDPDAGVPPLHLLEVPHIPRPTSRDYARAEFPRFAEVLTTWTGTALDATELARAIESREAARAALAARRAKLPGSRFLELRLRLDQGPVDPVRREWDDVSAALPSGRPRLVLSGSGHDHPGVTLAIESAGFDVVGDDHPDGELGLGARSSAPTLDALADRYAADGPTPHRSSPRERAEHLARLVDERRADGVLVYVRRFDDAPLWDVAAQRGRVAVPLVLVSGQEYGEIDAADLARVHAELEGAARV
jgi:benzoyl-CoA reductase/2-hydroxyglutaryl-CoA dehydratase subunit BcrC/BadD/HgdB